MWFKNLYLYRLPKNWAVDTAQLEEHLARLTLQGCSATDPRSIGWVPPRDGGALIHSVNQAASAGAASEAWSGCSSKGRSSTPSRASKGPRSPRSTAADSASSTR